MRKIDFAMRQIQRSIDAVSQDYLTPAQTIPEVTDQLIDLANSGPPNQDRFAQFLIDLPARALTQEILIHILPTDKRDIIHDLRAQHEDLERLKQNQVDSKNFEAAAATRDQQLQIYNRVREHLSNIQLYITPSVIDASLQSLGWNPKLDRDI